MEKNIVETSLDFHGKNLTLTAGKFAPQSDISVLAKMGETTVLAVVVSAPSKEDPGFLPLTVSYEERLYAGGLIKSAKWIKREGKPTDESVVTGRLVDHAIRPLFPKDYRDQVQLVLTVLSVDKENSPELLSLIAASAALTASKVPFNGPLASIQIGLQNDAFIYNPSAQEHSLDLELTVSYLEGEKLQAVEGLAFEVPDEKIKEAFKEGYIKAEPLFAFINDFAKKIGNKKADYISYSPSKQILEEVVSKYESEIEKIVSTPKKKVEYWAAVNKLKEEAKIEFEKKYGEDFDLAEVEYALDSLFAKHLRNLALNEQKRIDGRGIDEVRNISSEVGLIPQVHGSALFERGLTQVLSITTLDSPSNTLLSETLYGEVETRYFHHYIAPGFSTGEPAPVRSPGRREIGHGKLAEKSLIPVLPSFDQFPYVIRVVSEVLSQNGSSSMGSVCGSTLSLMDAGVPIKAPVGGISIGLITNDEKDKFVILTDIQGAEDFAGFMDYKMAGTKNGVTAIQMDIKLNGIPLKLFDEIIDKSKKARLHVLTEMEKTLSKPNAELKENAPKVSKIFVEKDEVGLIIGTGGKTIREIEERTGASLDVVEESGKNYVVIMSRNKDSLDKAVSYVTNMTKKPEIGETYEGRVTKLMDFGAFVEFLPGKEGLVHVSEISNEYVKDVRDHLKEGDTVTVRLKDIDQQGRNVLTMKL